MTYGTPCYNIILFLGIWLNMIVSYRFLFLIVYKDIY